MENDDARTIWCGNLSEKVSEDILYELFLQGGPLQKVNIPKDRDGKQKNFGFVTYKHLCSVPYALDLFDGTCLFNRPLNLKNRNSNSNASNNADNNFAQQQYYQQMQPANIFDNIQIQSFQNPLQLGQQIFLGNQALNAYNMMPGCVSYASQSNDLQGSDHGRDRDRDRNRDRDRSSRHNRHHPYQNRDRHDDRQNGRQDSYNRDHKSYRQSSHRSNRHDNRRKY